MEPLQVLSLVVGVGGFIVVVYFTTDLATMYFGADPLPTPLRPLVAHVTTANRLTRTAALVIFLVLLETTVAFVLLTRRDELSAFEQALFLGEFVAATLWTLWLVRRYRRHLSQRGAP